MANPVNGTPAAFNAAGTKLADVTAFKAGDRVSASATAQPMRPPRSLTLNPQTGDVTWTPAVANPGHFHRR